MPEDALFAPDPGFSFAVKTHGGDTILTGAAERPEDLVAAVGSRPVVAHDAKSLGQVPAVLALDTEVAAYLLEPAARAYPLRELAEHRGFATALRGRGRGRRAAARGAGGLAARGDPRPRA